MKNTMLKSMGPLLAAAVLLWGGATTVNAQATQKQWQLAKAGDARTYKLQLVEVPVPKPGNHEVQIKIHAASLNRRDIAVMQGNYPMPPRGMLVPLSDGAGEISAVGPGVTRFKVGDKVIPIFFPNWIKGRPTGNATDVSLG